MKDYDKVSWCTNNSNLCLFQKLLMTVGIDVYHDGKTRKAQSIGAFVASMNNRCTRWYSRVAFQQPGQELIDSLKVGFTAALRKFHEVCKFCATQYNLFILCFVINPRLVWCTRYFKHALFYADKQVFSRKNNCIPRWSWRWRFTNRC